MDRTQLMLSDGRNVTDGIRLVDILQYDKHNRKDLK